MKAAAEIQQLGPGLFRWEGYDPAVKADLCSCAVLSGGELFIVDPVALLPTAMDELTKTRNVAGIIVTNANHERASFSFAEKLHVPVFAREQVAFSSNPQTRVLAGGERLGADLQVVAIEGAALGEIALVAEGNGGTVIVGDALINFEPYGFTFLPAKYCDDSKRMQRSLRQLLDFTFERMLFAHGAPIVSQAREKLARLLATSV